MSLSTNGNRLDPDVLVPEREFVTVAGEKLRVPESGQLVHLQFRRFAGCPVCNLHLRSFVQRHDEIAGAGIREVVFFHSSAEELREHVSGLPFAVVADPEKRFYTEFGVEAGRRALLDPRAWGPILRGVFRSLGQVLRRRAPLPKVNPEGGRFGLPADFLIDGQGRVIASHYGEHVYDQWSVGEMLALARTGRSSSAKIGG
ncbi:peroxiredoxin-like family protein [Amycolatopsis cynarae]|uniref:Peroxiredoxin-like family protein n=1 Tax=Amycolatopsis cynarae TaxID=2995223 RepID=A0ABY7AY48_9PSEU|nr:peroxiredoxin-like family protein [Amycolatopsis sp. HUAS 11-8]WAL64954.1 peroxiredoxin-like family protein [Amycolatopsis sp. HUAS 11-8]